YRAARLTGYQTSDGTRYFTRWVQNAGGIGWYGYFGKTGAEFDDLNAALKAQGFYLVDASGYDTAGGRRYAGIWYKNAAGLVWKVFRDSTKAEMQQLVDTIGQQGWVPQRIEGYAVGNQSRYISLWYLQPGQGYRLHSRLTRAQYQAKLDAYAAQGYKIVHLDSHAVGNKVYFSGIWKPMAATPRVRSDRDWRVFQRYYNNYWADGYNIDNFYAAETPDGIRYGGIWYFDGAPNVTDESSLYLRVRKEVDGAPARGGAAIINLDADQEVMLHADQEFALASTAKIGVLYALLREVDAGNISWTETINSGPPFGLQAASPVQPNTDYTAQELAELMIGISDNYATNLLIREIGMATINQHLSDPATLDLQKTRINRYAVGLGAPSVHGNNSAYEDRLDGWENTSTPREMATLLRRVIETDILTGISKLRFFATLRMDGDNDGVNEKIYFASQIAAMGFNPPIIVFNKPGGLPDIRIVRADAGAMVLPDGERVVFAVFMDEITDDPDVPGVASDATQGAAGNAIRNVAREVAIEYYP
ncbi:MAG TPA: serine hydrolase, partial [Blastocatellia bacterium]|nr:serine hydrolase [Blastocatellia bacterium]